MGCFIFSSLISRFLKIKNLKMDFRHFSQGVYVVLCDICLIFRGLNPNITPKPEKISRNMKIQIFFSTYDLFTTLKNKFCVHDVDPLRQNFRNKTSKTLFVLGLTVARLCSFSQNSRFSTKKCQKQSIFFNLRPKGLSLKI